MAWMQTGKGDRDAEIQRVMQGEVQRCREGRRKGGDRRQKVCTPRPYGPDLLHRRDKATPYTHFFLISGHSWRADRIPRKSEDEVQRIGGEGRIEEKEGGREEEEGEKEEEGERKGKEEEEGKD